MTLGAFDGEAAALTRVIVPRGDFERDREMLPTRSAGAVERAALGAHYDVAGRL